MTIEGRAYSRKIQCEDFGAEPVTTGAEVLTVIARTNAAAIQAALDRAYTLGGGTVTIDEPGTYYVSAQLTGYGETEFRLGAGVILRPHTTLGSAVLVASSVSNFGLTGAGKIVCTSSTVPSFTDVDGLTVDVRVEDSDGEHLPYSASLCWIPVSSWPHIRLTGTGTCTVDARDGSGLVTSSVDVFTAIAALDQHEYPSVEPETTAIRFTLTGTCIAEVV